MRRLAPYQLGLWLAEYLNIRCQLCGCYRKHASFKLKSSNHALSTPQKSLLCDRCQHSIPWRPAPFYVDIRASVVLPIQVASYYDYPVRQAIRDFKHSEDMTRLPFLIHMLRQLPRPEGCHAGNSVIIPMPTTDSRLIKRGFDPVTILSTYLSKHWQIPLWHGVERMDDTVSQQGLSRSERLTNLNDAFVRINIPPVRHLLLFDDVATTGASLQALARAVYPSSSDIQDVGNTTIHIPNSDPTIVSSLTHLTDNKKSSYHILAYALAHGSQNQK